MADQRIQARIDFLKKNRPNDPEIAQLQKKLGAAPGATPAPAIDQAAQGYASDLAASSGVNQAFNPTLDPRMGTGDLIADRQRQEQELQAYLGRDLDTDYAKAREMRAQELYNQGIAPGDPRYNTEMKMLEDSTNRQKADIRAQALQFGGQEMDRLFGMGEQRRANQYNEQLTTNQTNMGNVGALSDIDLAYQQLAQQKKAQQQQYRLGRGQLGLQRQALARQGGGGGGGGQTPAAQSPFVDG